MICFLAEMKNTLPHLARRDGGLYVAEIETGNPVDANDFTVLIPFDGNVTGLEVGDITVTAVDAMGDSQTASVEGLEGENSVYEATIRPPSVGGAGDITITLASNATDQGNAEQVLALAYSDEIYIPDWFDLFTTTGDAYEDIVSVSRDGVQMLRDNQIDFFWV